MEIYGVIVPLWAVFLCFILFIIVAWKLIKFAFKFLLIAIIVFIILIGLDVLGVFGSLQNIIEGFL